MGREDDRHDDDRFIDDETRVISDGRHAASGALAGDSADRYVDASAEDASVTDPEGPAVNEPTVDDSAVDDPARERWGIDGASEYGNRPTPDPGAEAGGDAGAPYAQRSAIDPPLSAPDRQQVALPPGPALVAVGLGLLTKNGWVFQDINLTLRQSSVAAIVGPAGTGRTSLLLALVGRMEANTGTLTVAGHSLKDRPKNVRAVTSVARAGRLTAPEPGLTVSESVAERCLIEDENVLAGRSRFEEACAALHLEVDPTTLVGRLAGERATLLAVALACVRVSAVIVLDDLDRDVSAATQQRMMDALIRLAKAVGPTIIVSTTDRIPVMEADIVLDLTPMDGAAIWELDPRNAPTEVISHQLRQYQASPWAAELPVVDEHPNHQGSGPADHADNGDGTPADDTSGHTASDTRSSIDTTGDTDVTGGDGNHGDAHSASDHDGRWSRERWEAAPGSDPLEQSGRPAGPDQDPDPNGSGNSDRGGDATNATGPTEDPR